MWYPVPPIDETMARTILLVDDNKFIVEGLKAILGKRGYQTHVAFSGEDALKFLEKSIPDLVLLDISMEPMDGWETLERIRQRPESLEIPVIIFSARKTLTEEAERLHLDVSAVISKPINTVQLIQAIERALHARKTDSPKLIEPKLSALHINIDFEHHLPE